METKKSKIHLRLGELSILKNALYYLGSKLTLVDKKNQLSISPRVKLKFTSQDVHHDVDELLGVVDRDGVVLTSVVTVDDKPIHVSLYYKMLNKMGAGISTLNQVKGMSLKEKAKFILRKSYFSLTPSYHRESLSSGLEEFLIFDSLSKEERNQIISLGNESLEALKKSSGESQYQKVKL